MLDRETEVDTDNGVSELDDFILVPSKRNRKPVTRLSISGRKPPRSKSKENPCLKTSKTKKQPKTS